MSPYRSTETSEWPGTLLAVYDDPRTADSVARTVVDLGADPSDVRLGDDTDEVESLMAEMQEEVNRAIVAPPAGVAYPREASRSLVVVGLPIVAVCVLVALPVALFPLGGMVWWARILLVVTVTAVAGTAVAMVVGPSIGVRRPNEPLAAQRGTVVRVDHASAAALNAMADAAPIRLDHIEEHDDTMTAQPLTTEDLAAGRAIVDEIRRNTADPLHENDPGYPPPTAG